ncbi:MAG: ATP-binding protein, partial [Proteobacteria bacterium]|nr:ATP-binding protein [Pseudomonadota bacterium]
KGADGQGYVISDDSVQGSPDTWARAAVLAYHDNKADGIVAESNQGGEMVKGTIHTVDPEVPVTLVHASRGKATRAEPVAARYEQGKIHHVGTYPILENEMCLWIPGQPSPNRMDALVWVVSSLFGIGEIFIA